MKEELQTEVAVVSLSHFLALWRQEMCHVAIPKVGYTDRIPLV